MDSHATNLSRAASIADSTSRPQPDLICFSHLRWNFVTQRPQHLMLRAAADRRVFFWEEPIWHDAGDLPTGKDGSLGMELEINQEGSALWVVKPHMAWGIDYIVGQRALLGKLQERFAIKEFVRWYYTPMSLQFSDHLKPVATVYDCMDELSGFLGAPPELIAWEKKLFTAADVVFTGGISLYEAKRSQHKNVHAFPSSIEVEHFAKAKGNTLAEPSDQAEIAHPRAGFCGVIDERLDLALLADVARLRPQVQFVMLGPVVKIDPATLPQAENIHYLGSKKYEELPAYFAGWSVGLLPFALNDATRYISPTKTPEYLAAGKTVVSTPIRDVIRDYGDAGLVGIADTPENFVTKLDLALLPQTDTWREGVGNKLAKSSWDSTWSAMRREIVRATQEAKSIADGNDVSSSIKLAPALSSLRIDSLTRLSGGQRSRRVREEQFDFIVVGAGFAGSVLAERLASQLDKRVLVVDKREHIAGNAYDAKNADGILIHRYGPHIFHTNSSNVVSYLSQFTAWRPYEHKVLSSVDGKLLPVPINLDTINQLYNLNLDADGMKSFLDERKVACANIRTSEELVMSRVGQELYEKFFKHYTRKQWGLDPSQLDSGVAGRIPVRFDRDDRYFTDSFQAMPLHGYTAMFERILDHPNITVKTAVAYEDVAKLYPDAKVIYTGPIDEYFDYKFGPLPYRSLEFKHETHAREIFQAVPVVNYPNDKAYTRITEFKYLTGQRHAKTSIVYEYPTAVGDPYYPIPRPENAAVYAKYKQLAEQQEDVYFCGRLANYQYLNMDQVVAQALTLFREIAKEEADTYVVPKVGATLANTTVLEAAVRTSL